MMVAMDVRQGSRHRQRLRDHARSRRPARPPAGAGRRALRPAARPGRGRAAAGRAYRARPDVGRRTRPSGSWTTATPTGRSPRCAATASGCSRGTWSSPGLAAGPTAADPDPGRAGGGRGRRRRRSRSSMRAAAAAGRSTVRGRPGVDLDRHRGRLRQPAPGLPGPGSVHGCARPDRRAGARPGRLPGRRQRRVRRARQPVGGRRSARTDAGGRARRRGDPCPAVPGRCAVAAVALAEAGQAEGTATIDVPGGRLTVTLRDGRCVLAGPAVIVATGTSVRPGAVGLRGHSGGTPPDCRGSRRRPAPGRTAAMTDGQPAAGCPTDDLATGAAAAAVGWRSGSGWSPAGRRGDPADRHRPVGPVAHGQERGAVGGVGDRLALGLVRQRGVAGASSW